MARRSTGFWVYRRGEDGGLPPPPPPPPFVYVAPRLMPDVWYVVTITDRQGTVIGELPGLLEPVTWGTDGYGMAAMILPLRDAMRYGPLLEFGNRVLIEFSAGLPPWCGVVDVPRETTLGKIRVQFYESSYMLGWRLTRARAIYARAQARSAAAILSELVWSSDLGWTVNTDLTGYADPVEVEFNYETLAAAADKLRGLDAHMHYFTRPRPTEGGQMGIELVIFDETVRAGGEAAILIQGHNLVNWSVLEQGPIHNDILVGTGDFTSEMMTTYNTSGTTVTGGTMAWAGDLYSQQRYGKRQHLATLPEVEGQESLWRAQQHARALAYSMGQPVARVSGVSLNLPPGRFGSYGIGARVRIEADTPMATSEEMLIIGMEFRPAEGTMSLVFDDGGAIGG